MQHFKRWHHQGHKFSGGKAEVNSTKPAYREEAGNRTGAIKSRHMEELHVPGLGSLLNVWDLKSLSLVLRCKVKLHFMKLHLPMVSRTCEKVKSYKLENQLWRQCSCPEKRERGQTCKTVRRMNKGIPDSLILALCRGWGGGGGRVSLKELQSFKPGYQNYGYWKDMKLKKSRLGGNIMSLVIHHTTNLIKLLIYIILKMKR